MEVHVHPTDRAAGKRTLAVRLGPLGTRMEYTLCWVVALVWPLLSRPYLAQAFWLPWLVAPLVAHVVTQIWSTGEAAALNRALRDTARLHLAYGLLLAGAHLA
ncbi:MAG: hypothetical protein C4303_03545 [candidate division GAL15 bacterium]